MCTTTFMLRPQSRTVKSIAENLSLPDIAAPSLRTVCKPAFSSPMVTTMSCPPAAQRWFFDSRGGLHPYNAPTKCQDVPSARDANQQGLHIWDCNGTPAQQWSTTANNLPGVFNPINRGLQSRLNNMCIDVFAWDYNNNKQLVTWPCNGQNNQRWVTDWRGVMRSTHNIQKCMDASAGNNGKY